MTNLSLDQWKKYIIAPTVVIAVIVIFPKFWDVIVFLLLIISIHETGHYLTARKFGYDAQLRVFTPFLAAVKIKQKIQRQRIMIMIVLAGPVPGIIIGGLIILVSYWMSNDYLYWLGAGFILINGLNLFPVFPTDGYLVWSYLFSFNKLRTLWFSTFSAILTGIIMLYSANYLLLLLLIYQVLFTTVTLIYYKKINYDKVIGLSEYHQTKDALMEIENTDDDDNGIIINDLSTIQIVGLGLLHVLLTAFCVIFIIRYFQVN